MKKISKILLVLLTTLFISNVDAFEKGQSFTFGKKDYPAGNSVIINDTAYFSHLYNVDDNVPIYCIDPGLATPDYLYVERILMDNPSYLAQDAGILQTIRYDGNEIGDEERFVRSVAVRILINGSYGWSLGASSVEYGLWSGYINTFKAIAPEMEHCCTAAGTSTCTKTKFGSGSNTMDFGGYSQQILNAFCKGYSTSKNFDPLNYESPLFSRKIKSHVKTETGSIYFIEFSGTNFFDNSDAWFKIGTLKTEGPVTANILGISSTYENDPSKYTDSLPSDKNSQTAYMKNNDGKMYVAVELKYDPVYISKTECNIKVSIPYTSYHPLAVHGAILTATGYDTTSYQRFAIFSNDGNDSVDIEPCTEGCDETKEVLPNVCKDLSEPNADGNVVYSYREAYFDTKYEIASCILDKKDAALNSYKSSVLQGNPFCSLFCKEDYVFNVPYTRLTENGRYFQLDGDIAASQSCYTTEINSSGVESKLIELNQELIDAYNTYLFYNRLATTAPSKDTSISKKTCKTTSGTWDTNSNYDPDAEEDYDWLKKQYYYFQYTIEEDGYDDLGYYGTIDVKSGLDYIGDVNLASIGAGLTFNGNRVVFGGKTNSCSYKSCTSGYSDESGYQGSCSGDNNFEWSTYMDDYNELKSSFATIRDDAAQTISQILNQMESYVIDFNTCTGTGDILTAQSYRTSQSKPWEVDFKYDPVISYSYDEPNIKSYDSDKKWIKLAEKIGANVMASSDKVIYKDSCNGGGECKKLPKLDYENGGLSKSETVSSKTFCYGSVDNEYNCTGTEVARGNVKNYVKPHNTEFFTVDGNVVTRVIGGINWNLTTINYISTYASAASKFDTPRVYYTSSPTGKIAVQKDKPSNEYNAEGVYENYSTVDGLPVSIQTPMGTYYYKLIFDNIGTFYSTSDLGRIYGTSGNSLSNLKASIELKEGYDKLESNGYACTYVVGANDTCTDSAGTVHTCSPGMTHEECVAAFCPGTGPYCIETSEHGYCNCSTTEYKEGECNCAPHTAEGRKQILSQVCSGYEDDEYCPNNISCCPYCQIVCIGKCIFENRDEEEYDGQSMLDFRAVNPSQLNPNNRHLGYNWYAGEPSATGNYNWSTGELTNVLVAQKAGITIDEIQSRAKITDIDGGGDKSKQLKALTDYSLDVTLTPSMVKEVKDYNKSALTKGSYNNQTLVCYDYILDYNYEQCDSGGFTWVPDNPLEPNGTGKCVMENIMCYSNFITYLKTEFGDELVNTYNRPTDPEKLKEHIGDVGDGHSSVSKYSDALSANFDYNLESALGSENTAKYNPEVKNVLGYWGIFKYKSIDINGDGKADIGPSWK